ncbi:MAG: PIN domain-containing protein [Gammaproteobacteria bacterium]
MVAVDTNVLLRYLLEPLDERNPKWQVVAARDVIEKADAVFVSDIVVAEMEWVLESVFELDRGDIAALMAALSSNYRFNFEDWVALQSALMDYREYGQVDFSDCLIARTAQRKGASTLFTFENMQKLGALPIATTLSAL